MEPAIILSTYPDRESAAKTADWAVQDGLAACATISEVDSVYRWQGKVERSPEFLVMFKTTQGRKDELRGRIGERHPYQVPEIVEIAVPSMNEPYLKWLAESVS